MLQAIPVTARLGATRSQVKKGEVKVLQMGKTSLIRDWVLNIKWVIPPHKCGVKSPCIWVQTTICEGFLHCFK